MNTAQASAIVSPIIDFATKTAKPKSPRRVSRRPDHPDAGLIEHCIEYASQTKAAEVCYLIDPTDSEFAAFADDLSRSRANRAMRQALELAPVTMDGLRAKAAVVVHCIDEWGGELTDMHRQFLASLAEDVIRFQRVSTSLHQNDVPVQVEA